MGTAPRRRPRTSTFRSSPSGRFWSFPLSTLCLFPATFQQCAESSGELCLEAAKEKTGVTQGSWSSPPTPPQGGGWRVPSQRLSGIQVFLLSWVSPSVLLSKDTGSGTSKEGWGPREHPGPGTSRPPCFTGLETWCGCWVLAQSKIQDCYLRKDGKDLLSQIAIQPHIISPACYHVL